MQFGSYTFPIGWGCSVDTDEQIVSVLQIPRSQGGAWLVGQRKPRKITVKGGFTNDIISNTSSASVRTAIDGLKSALLAGPSNFYLDTDRYLRNVQVESMPTNWADYFNLFAEITLGFVGPDPYFYSTTTTTTPDLHSTLSYTLASGNSFALPQWYFYANAALNAAFSWTWENTTTGESMVLSGAWPISGAGYLIVDSLAFTVQAAPSLGGTVGPADANMAAPANAFGLFEYQMPRLQQGVNNFTLVQTGAALAGAWAVLRGRWL